MELPIHPLGMRLEVVDQGTGAERRHLVDRLPVRLAARGAQLVQGQREAREVTAELRPRAAQVLCKLRMCALRAVERVELRPKPLRGLREEHHLGMHRPVLVHVGLERPKMFDHAMPCVLSLFGDRGIAPRARRDRLGVGEQETVYEPVLAPALVRELVQHIGREAADHG